LFRADYIPGFDPLPARRYRELYRREAAAQAAICGYEICVSASAAPTLARDWQVIARMAGAETRTQVEILVWSDIVKRTVAGPIWQSYRALVRTAWIYLASGTMSRLLRLRAGPVVAALYPVAMLFLQAAVALGLAAGAGWIAVSAVWMVFGSGEIGLLAGALTSGVVAIGLFRIFFLLDRVFYAHYLMRNYAFAAVDRGAYPPDLASRLTAFADRIAAGLDEDVDEVLVVGHSSGAYLAVSALAEVLRTRVTRHDGPALSLLTLGQVIPMVSFLPDAEGLRRDLRDLAIRRDFTWVDVSAPGDGCCFALCDPVTVSGVAPSGKRNPLVFSAAYSKALTPGKLKALRFRWFRLHFQYLCAFDRPGDYDYFAITAGPLTLADRYAGRPASRSRIEHAVSKHTSVAA
jgi:hypothetical protein